MEYRETYRGDYRIEEGGHFVQTLRWEEQENVFYYEVEIEKQAGVLWERHVRERTERSFLEVSLSPGIYRYRVRPYDFLERPRPAADWIQFEVLPAQQPELSRFSPEAFYLDEDLAWSIDLFGSNFTEGIAVFLQGSRGNLIKPDTVIVEQEDRIHLVFSYARLETGSYTIQVINPGGLTDNLGIFRITFRKPVDINISAGYRPMVSLYGHINELFETRLFPIGAYGRLSVIPFKKPWGYAGFELEPSWNYFRITQEYYTIRFQMPGGMLYGLYRYWFSNRIMALNFRIGGGIYTVLNYHFVFPNTESEPITVLIPAIGAGVSFQWFIKRPFFVEAGLDFTHFFTVDNPQPAYLRPFTGAGWQF
ncbi:MAG: hypothetical protein LBK64_05175 [Spirochaetaceae bacterium]|nr:hypothetical protein [Spirochaetaceae bacterium]